MAAPVFRDRLEMECIEGAWETLNGHQRYRFRGTVWITLTSLEHADAPVRTLEGEVEWIQPTPTPFALVEPVPIVEISSSEEDPEEDLEEDPEEEPEVQPLEPEVEMQPAPVEVDEPVVASGPEVESVEEDGPGWLVESGWLQLMPVATPDFLLPSRHHQLRV